MQTMDSDLAQLVRKGVISRAKAEQRASVPEELKRLLGGTPNGMPNDPGVDAGSEPQPAPAAGAPSAPATMM